jgi:hypothetical protein
MEMAAENVGPAQICRCEHRTGLPEHSKNLRSEGTFSFHLVYGNLSRHNFILRAVLSCVLV